MLGRKPFRNVLHIMYFLKFSSPENFRLTIKYDTSIKYEFSTPLLMDFMQVYLNKAKL